MEEREGKEGKRELSKRRGKRFASMEIA